MATKKSLDYPSTGELILRLVIGLAIIVLVVMIACYGLHFIFDPVFSFIGKYLHLSWFWKVVIVLIVIAIIWSFIPKKVTPSDVAQPVTPIPQPVTPPQAAAPAARPIQTSTAPSSGFWNGFRILSLWLATISLIISLAVLVWTYRFEIKNWWNTNFETRTETPVMQNQISNDIIQDGVPHLYQKGVWYRNIGVEREGQTIYRHQTLAGTILVQQKLSECDCWCTSAQNEDDTVTQSVHPFN